MSSLSRCILLLLLALSSSSFAQDKQSEWTLYPVPETWKKNPRGVYGGGEGYVWHRCLVDVPKSWEGRQVELFLEPIDDAREAFVNGERVGGAGQFPPRFRSGLGGESRHAVPAEAIRFGELNTVTVRRYHNDGRANFNVAAPALFAGDEAIRLEGQWQVRPGDDFDWAEPLAERPMNLPILFDRVEDAEHVAKTLKKLEGEEGPLSPKESLATMKTPDDLKVELALSEPHIGQPLSMKWDARGRLWVMQYLQYPNPAGLTMVSRDMYLRSVYDKTPPPPPNHFPGADKISIHEDTDGDGKYDSHKTFVEGLSLTTSFAIGRGGVWVLNPPYLLFYPDRNKDDVPDGDPTVHLSGFGIEDSHSIANNLRWGPDGWLYACQGSTVTGAVKRPGLDKEPVNSMGQLIWRYHPDTRRYEIFAEGGGNAFGLEFDAKGRVYSGTNGGDSRGYHYVQGGYFRKSFGKHGSLSNPFAFGFFPDMQHHKVPRFTHTFVIYEGESLPAQYHGKLFGVAPLQSHVVYSEIQPDGSTLKTKDLGKALTTEDTWVRPVDIQAGPDGALYVADFYEQRIDHASHYQGRVQKDSGRIFRLRGKQASAAPAVDLAKLPGRELLKVLGDKNKWRRQQALRLIGDRRDRSLIPHLKLGIKENEGQFALEALWALNLCGGFDATTALQTMEHPNPHVRLWTVRLLGDHGEVSPTLSARMAELAYHDGSVHVRSQLASTAKRLSAAAAMPIVRNLLRHGEDAKDPHMPLLLWWAVEAHADEDREHALAMLDDETVWDEPIVKDLLLSNLMRRYAQSGSRRNLLTCAELLEKAPSAEHAKLLMAGFERAFEGRSLALLPQRLAEAIEKTGGASLALRLRKAGPKAVSEAVSRIQDGNVKANERRQLVQILGQIRAPQAIDSLLSVVQEDDNDEIRAAALTALQSYNDPRIGQQVVKQHNDLPEDVRQVAQTLLVSRPAWTKQLLKAVEGGAIAKPDVPMPIVRKMLFHADEKIAAAVESHWGEIQGATTEQMREQIQKLTEVIHSGSGNPYSGRELFSKNCGKCHVLFGEGGKIGPDLTAFKRDDLKSMTLHVINPSAEIREGFENFVITTLDGRTLNGFIADRDNQIVVLKGVDGQSVSIPVDEIEEMRAVPRSVMPEGALKDYSDQQVRDLFAYLRATQPLP